MHNKEIVSAGMPLGQAEKVLIMLHGRESTAEDILSLAQYLTVKDFTLLAPQAANHTWYPFSFLAPVKQNEPWLSSALKLLESIVGDVTAKGIGTDHIYFLGFSQGACLMIEFLARHAAAYGGVAVLTGGLIGDKINADNYTADFKGTPIFMGSGDPDPHVPIERFYATGNILKSMHAAVTEKVYVNLGHTINQDELDNVNRLIFNS